MKAGGELSGYREIQEKLKAPLGYPLPFFLRGTQEGKGGQGKKDNRDRERKTGEEEEEGARYDESGG